MHLFLHLLAASTTSTTTKGSKSSSSSSVALLVIIGLFAVVYFLFIRPRTQRMRQQQSAGKQLSVGDQVMSAGGIFGTVVALDADVVEVEVAPGVVMSFIPRAVSLRTGTQSGSAAAPTPPAVHDDWDGPPAVSGSTGPPPSDGSKPAAEDEPSHTDPEPGSAT
jgi:preprotein translocase subunit YajC